MTPLTGETIAIAVALCGLVLLTVALIAMRRILPQSSIRPTILAMVEITAASAFLMVIFTWPLGLVALLKLGESALYWKSLGWPTLVAFSWGVVVLSLVRGGCERSTVLLTAITYGFFCYCLVQWLYIAPRMSSVMEQFGDGAVQSVAETVVILGPPIQALRLVVWICLPFLAGIYAIRAGFNWWKFIGGAITAGWLVGWLISPVLMTENLLLIIQPIGMCVFYWVLLSLQGFRRNLSRLFGVTLEEAVEPDSDPDITVSFSKLVGHVALAALAASLFFLFWLGQHERRQIRVLLHGPEFHPPLPSATNAYPALRKYFLRPAIRTARVPAYFNYPRDVHSSLTLSDNETLLEEIDRDRLDQDLDKLDDYTRSFIAASTATYLQVPRGGRKVSFLPIRETAQALTVRSWLSAMDGNTTAALADAHTVMKFGGFMRSQPSLVHQMIGVAVQGFGLYAAYRAYIVNRSSRDALVQLDRILDDVRPTFTASLDIDALQRGEPGLLRVVPNAEMMVPNVARAIHNTRVRGLQFEQLRIATAFELYKADHGTYPYKLSLLTPEYLFDIPREPFEGKEFVYQPGEHDFLLTTNSIPTTPQKPALEPLPFPPLGPAVDNSTTGTPTGH